MRYTDLARELAVELDAPAEEVLSDLMSAMHAHGWLRRMSGTRRVGPICLFGALGQGVH